MKCGFDHLLRKCHFCRHLLFRMAPQPRLKSSCQALITFNLHHSSNNFTTQQITHIRPVHPLNASKMSTYSLTRLPRLLSRRAFTTSARHGTSFKVGPAPPRLPKEDQELFEKLQKTSTGAFSQPIDSTATKPDIQIRVNQSPDSTSSPSPTPSVTSPSNVRMQINQSPDSDSKASIKSGDEFHPNMRRGAPPEFEGETNPKTGEVGGPKNEPLRWGGAGDWSYNGRVTDF
jgi:hypothetical protein